MHVNKLRLINYRNYDSLNIDINKKTNIFIGKNAQGKTNLLESIYLCATGKSFRTNRDREIINFNKDQAYVGADITVGNFNKFIEVKMERGKTKTIRVNKTELKNYKELYSGLNVVVFSPEDLSLVKGGPQERRDFLNTEISQLKPVYNYNISRYRKVLFQRNNMLKTSKFKKDITSILDIFDLQLVKLGTEIILERNKYILELSKISNKTHKNITLDKEELDLNYISNVDIMPVKKDMERKYLNDLKNNMENDLRIGSTGIGPHRDDIGMRINGNDLKTYGSQGQQRTVVLSIKLSEVELIKKERGIYPVLLLDDVFSELDEERRKYLIRSFKDMQTLITVTDAIDIEELDNLEKTLFYIDNGKIV